MNFGQFSLLKTVEFNLSVDLSFYKKLIFPLLKAMSVIDTTSRDISFKLGVFYFLMLVDLVISSFVELIATQTLDAKFNTLPTIIIFVYDIFYFLTLTLLVYKLHFKESYSCGLFPYFGLLYS